MYQEKSDGKIKIFGSKWKKNKYNVSKPPEKYKPQPP